MQANSLSKRVFDGLGDTPDVNLAWNLVGKKVVSSFAGKPLIPIPFLNYKMSPCAPGFVVMKQVRSFKEWIRNQPNRFLFTECVWDFQPVWSHNCRVLKTSSKMEDNENSFVYDKYRTYNGQTKYIRVGFSGKEISSLDELPFKMFLDLKPFAESTFFFRRRRLSTNNDINEDTCFDELEIYLVDKVFSINSGFIEVGIGDEIVRKQITSRFPIGFTMMKLFISIDDKPGVVEFITRVNPQKWRGVWLDRTVFRMALHQYMANQRKYGGAAGDVNGAIVLPFELLILSL